MEEQPTFEIGTQVMVSRADGPKNELTELHESGTVLGVGLEFIPPGSSTPRHDGILVKLQISNTRCIVAPTHVSLPPSSPPASQRRKSKRVRVTPSPTIALEVSGNELSSEVESTEKSEKRQRTSVDLGKAERDTVPVESATSATESKYFGSNSNDAARFRVQVAPSSSSKCRHCLQLIAKNILRIQLADTKRLWYHVTCAKESIDPTSAREMEGFSELSESEQQLLRTLLEEAPVDQVAKIEEEKDNKEEDEEEDSDVMDDPPLSSLKRPSNERNTKLKTDKGPEAQDEDDDMIRASETDSDDLKDMPYRVEYAPTGRAACRGCDERIAKGFLRIAECPLFRGKPGFTVYRHLQCTTFPKEIKKIQDVSGWRRIKKIDRQAILERIEESTFLVDKENQELEPDELVQVNFQGEILPPPNGLSAILLPFQVEGFSWMVHQELHVPDIRGGILADEMGMGKTLQTITTILSNRPKLQWTKPGAKHPPGAPDLEDRLREEKLWNDSLETWKSEMEKCNVPKKLIAPKQATKGASMGARGGTLVICPVIALYQWREEIKKFTDENALTVCCYHGTNRAQEFPRELLCKYDVVLTTYQVIEADFRKMVSPNKVKCPNCGGSYKIDKLRVHLKYFCGESAQRTEAQARQHRTADRHNRGTGHGGRGGSKGRKQKKSPSTVVKKSFAKTTTKSKTKRSMKPMTTEKTKKTVRARSTRKYDSDSDLSVESDVDVNSPRPRRSAAASAAKRMSASAKQWGGGDSTDSEASQGTETSTNASGDDSSLDVPPITKTTRKQTKAYNSESSDSQSEDEVAILRAKKKQALALTRAKANTKKNGKGPKKEGGKGKGKRNGQQKGRKTTPPPDDSSTDEESSDVDEEDRDPLEGIDLDKLMKDAMEGSRASVLHTMCWWRVVLDEAHMIKSRASQTAAAAFSLTSIHRWCLSGTPLQNRVGELYSLIRFLRIDPMAHYFCRKDGCSCKSVHYRMLNGKCQDCGHGTIQHFSYFNKHVLNPIQRAGYQGDGRRAMMKLKCEVLDKSLIRRTKQSRAEDMNLPPRVVQIRPVRLHPIEEDFYNALYTQTKSSFDDYVTQGTLLNNYAHIFDLLTKMRQAVDHPYLIVYSKKNTGVFSAPNAPAVANGTIDCELCNEPPTDRVVSACCGSAFCRSCVLDYMTPSLDNDGLDQGGTHCPSCRAPFSIDLNQESCDLVDDSVLAVSQETGSDTAGMPSLKDMSHVSSGSILRRINLAEFATSTKVEALVEELVQMRQHRPGSKALVFSQFVNMLDLVRWRLHSDPCLQDLGLGVRIIHGGMNVQSRDEALKCFREDHTVRVLLMSLKAGGVALNLTVANEAYLLDPWWNPAAEMQAIDRTHRLGQHRPIRAIRFIAEGTVEERVLQLQEKKRLVFDGTVGRDAASLKMLTADDMKALFA